MTSYKGAYGRVAGQALVIAQDLAASAVALSHMAAARRIKAVDQSTKDVSGRFLEDGRSNICEVVT